MEALNTSEITNSSESAETSGTSGGSDGGGGDSGFISCTENELSFDTDVWEISQGDVLLDTGELEYPNNNESIIFEVTSFPTITESSSSSLSSSFVTAPPPEVVEIKCRRRTAHHYNHHHQHRRKKKKRTNNNNNNNNNKMIGHQHSSPYAQLCFDPNQKTLVTMLEIDIINGPRRRHSRLPLDAPSPEDYFPWLHKNTTSRSMEEHLQQQQDSGIPGLASSSWSFSCSTTGTTTTVSTVSGLTEIKDDLLATCTMMDHDDVDPYPDGYGEPIVLSGWMMDADAAIGDDEEADVYWLLNDGKDVWVKIDDGCAKALRKMFACCGTWRLKLNKRSNPSSSSSTSPRGAGGCSPDARDEKRFRYSMLH